MARRFGRGRASVLGSWEVVEAEVQLAQINPSSQVDLPEAETKKSSRKERSVLHSLDHSRHPPQLVLSDHCLLSISFLTPWARSLPLRVASTSASATESIGSRSGLAYKTGKALEVSSGPLIIVGFKIRVYLCHANRKVHLSYVAYPAYCSLEHCHCCHSLRVEYTCQSHCYHPCHTSIAASAPHPSCLAMVAVQQTLNAYAADRNWKSS
jgi:hypothetical protein